MSTDQVSFGQPAPELFVEVARAAEAKGMEVIPRGERLDPPEARVLKPSSKDYMAVEPRPARRYLGKGHPHLKGNPSLFRQDPHRTDRPHSGNHLVKEGPDGRRLASKVMRQGVPAAGMGLIPVGEWPPALRTSP
ncbi:MAG TPA: hypothetical protein VGQ69_06225 [Gemmatimonadales bacterium]|nr:hypothetical protein [Gemmatimonadales bacterium]